MARAPSVASRSEAVRACLLSCAFAREKESRTLDEGLALARAIDLDVVGARIVSIAAPRAATLLGSGLVDELAEQFAREEIALAVVDADLTPIQQRNLERAWKVKVLDRTGLILEIFATRARSREGRLQVELARLTYQKSRLVRGWSHLERQRGGAGFLGGPGETQIEADRRALQQRITAIARQLENVRRARMLQSARRARSALPLMSLVGYTNCGKSTLFNRLTQADVLAKDMLFATLDPTIRGVTTAGGGRFLLADTVGFIRNLPPDLVLAFRATLEGIMEANFLLHVHDASLPEEERRRQAENVEAVLTQLGMDHNWEGRVLHIHNKIDKAAPESRIWLENQVHRADDFCLVSARTGEGMGDLSRLLETRISRLFLGSFELWLEPQEEECRAWLHRHGHIESETRDERGRSHLRVSLNKAAYGRFGKFFPQAAARCVEAKAAEAEQSPSIASIAE